jgi:sulfatase modifying factor 1
MASGTRSRAQCPRIVRRALAAMALIPCVVGAAGCNGSRSHASAGNGLSHGGAAGSAAAPPPVPATKPGMVYVPGGALLAGTPADQTPRVAEEELPGTSIDLGPFYIDALPFPDEAGAIATTNVTRDEAAALCATKSKRLCTELEWERACKGPANTTYEDGDAFRPATCGLGVAADIAARRPSGELGSCISGFGVRELHGGAWEWTAQPWGRGGRKDLGVLKGGNALAGEIAGRCANSLARPPTTKSPAMGFRCCAGAENDAKVDLPVKLSPPLERSMKTADLTAPWLPFARATWSLKDPGADGGAPFAFVHAFTWHPVGNETLVVASGCATEAPRPRCGLIVGRAEAGDDPSLDAAAAKVRVLLHVDTGYEAAEVAEAGEAKHLRFKGLDPTSAYLRDFTYAYGRIELAEPRR